MTTVPLSVSVARLQGWGGELVGVLLAVLAGSRHAILMTRATNDNFLHMTLAQQWLAGDWPVRDFYDGGWLLQYALSALAQLVVGDRLLSEAVIVGLAWGLGTYIAFHVVRGVTGSTGAAVLTALLAILAAARGYSYPKYLVYAVAAGLWWGYVRTPTVARAAGFGAWAGAAFLWRPDHGVYVAIAVALVAWAVHGFGRIWVARCAAAGATMIALIAPFLLYVHLTVGLPEYVRTGVTQARMEHATQGPHAWPLLRFGRSAVTVEPAESYAPIVALRWKAGSPTEERARLLASYDLALLESDDESTARVRLSERSIPRIPALINESIVEDTAGIDRSAATLSDSTWPRWQRWRYNSAWLRVRVLPGLDDQTRASEYAVALFYLLPLLLAAAAPVIARHGSVPGGTRALTAFAAFALLVDVAMLRIPFTARVFDAVVLSTIVFGFVVGGLWRGPSGHLRRALQQLGAVALTAIVTISVARAGQVSDLADAADLNGVFAELVASPPLAHYLDRPARFSLRLAAYVRACVPPSDRLLVLWFEPEIYFYSERLMAQRHLFFAPPWADLAGEQNMTIAKIKRFLPPLVLARRSALDEYARATYPGVVDYVDREYRLATTIENEGEQYLIFAKRGRPELHKFGPQKWPCFLPESSPWERVGEQSE